MDRSYVAKNKAARERLNALVARISDEELSHPLSAGWTISGVLAHLAFWDARGLYLIDKWESGIAPSEADHEPSEIDWINDASKPLCLALPPRTAAELALQVAEETDRRVEALSDSLVEQMMAAGEPLNLARANHRNLHLDEIEAYLSAKA